MLAAVVHLQAKATDDALELFDVLMTNDLMARAQRESKADTLRRHPRLSRDAAICAADAAGHLDAADVDLGIVPPGWWRSLVQPPGRPAGTVNRSACVFRVLAQFHDGQRHCDIYAQASTRWADPQAKLLTGAARDGDLIRAETAVSMARCRCPFRSCAGTGRIRQDPRQDHPGGAGDVDESRRGPGDTG